MLLYITLCLTSAFIEISRPGPVFETQYYLRHMTRNVSRLYKTVSAVQMCSRGPELLLDFHFHANFHATHFSEPDCGSLHSGLMFYR